jgi:hypothetical protein
LSREREAFKEKQAKQDAKEIRKGSTDRASVEATEKERLYKVHESHCICNVATNFRDVPPRPKLRFERPFSLLKSKFSQQDWSHDGSKGPLSELQNWKHLKSP